MAEEVAQPILRGGTLCTFSPVAYRCRWGFCTNKQLVYQVRLCVIAVARIRLGYRRLLYPGYGILMPVGVQVPVDSLRLLVSRLLTVSLLLLIWGRPLVSTSAVSSLTGPQFAKSFSKTVERNCRGPERIALPSMSSDIAIRELL